MIPGVAAAAASASIRISAAASRPQPRIGTPGDPRSPWCMGDRMYTLYWTADSGAFAVQAVLEELVQPYRREILMTAAGDHLRPDYLALNPMAQVPSLRLPDGTLMTESAAMLVHLCDAHTVPSLLPVPGSSGRAHAYRWLFWLATGLYESSLIGVVEVKLFLIGHRFRIGRSRGSSLLFAVGAWPPHDGVRRARRLNLFHDLAGFRRQVRDSQRDRLAHRPHGNDSVHPPGRARGVWSFSVQAAAKPALAPGSLPKRNSARSLHMRCRTTASLRATATRARAMPRCFATFMPQARRLDHFLLRTSNVWAAS